DDRRRRTYRILPDGQALVRAETERMLRVLRLAQARSLTPAGVHIPDAGAEAGA
ncbi:MAG: PadR family transcriptional regulator, partial [Gemmatimonadetes bacterium]|nr:PadR family transcriptional regulator [Gemmatimonadota bacterium]